MEWDYDRQNEPLLEADHFKLKAVPTSTEQDPDNEGTIFECFDNPYTRKGEIKLISPGTTYRVSVITYFKCGDIPPQESTEFVEVATPPEHMGTFETPIVMNTLCIVVTIIYTVRPTLKCNTTEQNSVTINSTKPLILENKDKFACQTLELTKIRYTIRKAPQDGNDGKGKEAKYLDFTPSYPSDDNAATPGGPAQSQRTVKGLKVGTKYFVTGQVEYNNGEIIESEEIPFETRPYTGTSNAQSRMPMFTPRFVSAFRSPEVFL